jgi:hypothetical protein
MSCPRVTYIQLSVAQRMSSRFGGQHTSDSASNSSNDRDTPTLQNKSSKQLLKCLSLVIRPKRPSQALRLHPHDPACPHDVVVWTCMHGYCEPSCVIRLPQNAGNVSEQTISWPKLVAAVHLDNILGWAQALHLQLARHV